MLGNLSDQSEKHMEEVLRVFEASQAFATKQQVPA